MKFPSLVMLALLLNALPVHAQRFVCENGFVSFYSQAPVENIKADNWKMSSIFNAGSGVVAFSVLMKEFQFEKKLMQEHFNDKYLESNRFPRSTFSGVISGYAMDKNGVQNVRAKGKLTIHGIVKSIDVPGTLEVKGNTLNIKSKFKILMADYDIKIPAVLWKNISEEVEVTIDLTYKP
jgi:hypothetical protein